MTKRNAAQATLTVGHNRFGHSPSSLDRLATENLHPSRAVSPVQEAMITQGQDDSLEALIVAGKTHLAAKLSSALVEGARDDVVGLIASNREIRRKKRNQVDQKNIELVCDTFEQLLFDADSALVEGAVSRFIEIAQRKVRPDNPLQLQTPTVKTVTIERLPGWLGKVAGQKVTTVIE